MDNYYKQITIEINTCYLEQILYLRIDLNINEIEIYYLDNNEEKRKELYFLGEDDIIKLKYVMNKDILDRLNNQIFENDCVDDKSNMWIINGNDNLSVKGRSYLPKEIKKVIDCVLRIVGKKKFSNKIKEY